LKMICGRGRMQPQCARNHDLAGLEQWTRFEVKRYIAG